MLLMVMVSYTCMPVLPYYVFTFKTLNVIGLHVVINILELTAFKCVYCFISFIQNCDSITHMFKFILYIAYIGLSVVSNGI